MDYLIYIFPDIFFWLPQFDQSQVQFEKLAKILRTLQSPLCFFLLPFLVFTSLSPRFLPFPSFSFLLFLPPLLKSFQNGFEIIHPTPTDGMGSRIRSFILPWRNLKLCRSSEDEQGDSDVDEEGDSDCDVTYVGDIKADRMQQVLERTRLVQNPLYSSGSLRKDA